MVLYSALVLYHFITNSGNEIKFEPGVKPSLPHGAACIAVIDIQQGCFVVKSPRDDYAGLKTDIPWLVVRNLTTSDGLRAGCKIGVGERIKIGKQEYKILEIQTTPKKEKELLTKLYVHFLIS